MAHLYKYFGLATEADYSYFIEMLNDGRVHMSDGKKYNDPFDVAVTDDEGNLQKLNGFRIL